MMNNIQSDCVKSMQYRKIYKSTTTEVAIEKKSQKSNNIFNEHCLRRMVVVKRLYIYRQFFKTLL